MELLKDAPEVLARQRSHVSQPEIVNEYKMITLSLNVTATVFLSGPRTLLKQLRHRAQAVIDREIRPLRLEGWIPDESTDFDYLYSSARCSMTMTNGLFTRCHLRSADVRFKRTNLPPHALD